MTSDTAFTKAYDAACEVIKEAGKLALTSFASHHTVSTKADNTIVTESDKAVETYIRTQLSQAFPDYGFIGEETDEENRDISWVVDPIDGTVAYARGIPEFGNMIALKQGESIVFSLIFLPTRGDLYSAQKGQGAYRNNQKISVSSVTSISQALLAFDTGNFFRKKYPQEYLDHVANLRIRMGHSIAVEGGYLAQGSIDGIVKFNQSIWDIAPAYLLVEEAGATITDKFGDPLTLSFNKTAKHDVIIMTSAIPQHEIAHFYVEKKAS